MHVIAIDQSSQSAWLPRLSRQKGVVPCDKASYGLDTVLDVVRLCSSCMPIICTARMAAVPIPIPAPPRPSTAASSTVHYLRPLILMLVWCQLCVRGRLANKRLMNGWAIVLRVMYCSPYCHRWLTAAVLKING